VKRWRGSVFGEKSGEKHASASQCRKLGSLGYIFIGLASVSLTGKMTQNSGSRSLTVGTDRKPLRNLLLVNNRVNRSRLRSSTSNKLTDRPSRLVTIGEWLFVSAGPKLWNSLLGELRLRHHW